MRPAWGDAHAGQRLDQLALPVAVDARDADDLAGADVHREPAHRVQAAIVAHPQVPHREHRLAGMRGAALDVEQHVAPDHQLGQAALARALAVDRRDLLAAPEHRDAVGDGQHLVQLVRDQDDRRAARDQRAQHGEQLVDLLRGEHRGGLVEDQHARLAIERLEDLDALLLADAELLDRGVRVDDQAVARRQLAHALARRREIELRVLARLRAEHDVLDDGHHRDQHEVLVHHADAEADGIRRARHLDPLAADVDLSLVGAVEAVEDVHERRLARAVLTQQRVHLALSQVEVDRVVGDERAEPLRDPAKLERQIGARARGTRGGGRSLRHDYLTSTLVGILTLPAFILTISALIFALMRGGDGAVDALDAGALLGDAEHEVGAALELAVDELADDVDDGDVDALGGRGEQLLGADLQRLVGVDADAPEALVASRVDGAEAALARDLEDDVRALGDLLLGEALALVLRRRSRRSSR